MSLTVAQLATLKTDIQSQGSLAVARTAADWITVANFYNAPSATPIWRTDLRNSEVMAALVGTDVAALSSAGSLGLLQILLTPDTTDASSVNIQTDFSTLFSGKVSLTNLTNVAQRLGTRLESLFSAGGPPATTVLFGYSIQASEVQKAMGF